MESKEELLKFLVIAREKYEAFQDEDSAEQLIDCYIKLYFSCRTGEDLEQLTYSDLAYDKAKEIAAKQPTEKNMDSLNYAKMALTSFYGLHGLENLKEKVNEDYARTYLLLKNSKTNKIKKDIGKVFDWRRAMEFADKYYIQANVTYMKKQKEGWKIQKPYADFVIEVMKQLAEEGVDNDLVYMVAALNNLMELTDCTREQLAGEFSEDIARLVEEVSQKGNEGFMHQMERYWGTLDAFKENMFVDICLADRLCKIKICGMEESMDMGQVEDFERHMHRYRCENWPEAERMGNELLRLVVRI